MGRGLTCRAIAIAAALTGCAGILPAAASAQGTSSPGEGFLVSVRGGGPNVGSVIYSGTLASPPTTCPSPGAPPPEFLISGGQSAPLTSGSLSVTSGPAGESVTGSGHVLDTDFGGTVTANADGTNLAGSLTTTGFFTLQAVPTCLTISGNAAVLGYRIVGPVLDTTGTVVSCRGWRQPAYALSRCTATVTDTTTILAGPPAGIVGISVFGAERLPVTRRCRLTPLDATTASCSVFDLPNARPRHHADPLRGFFAYYLGDKSHSSSLANLLVAPGIPR